jgi:hypothetical protein
MSMTKWTLGPMPQLIAQFEQSGMDGQQWGARLDEEIDCLLMDIFSPEEYLFFRLWKESPFGDADTLRKLDQVILRQAETAGWRLALSTLVHKRLSEWERESGGPKRFAALGNAFRRAARIFQGLELPPLDDPLLYVTKRETVRELNVLQQKLRQRFATGRCCAAEAREFFIATVSDENANLVALRKNLGRWNEFLADEANGPMLLCFVNGGQAQKITPTYLFDAWIAWCKGAARGASMDQQTVRKRISELGKYFRS